LAAQFAGISYDTLNAWMQKGKRKSSKDADHADYVAFSEAVEQANSQMAVACLTRVRRDESWQAQAWLLERRFPQHYGKQVTLDVTMNKLVAVAKQAGVSVEIILQSVIEELEGAGDGT